MHIYMIRIHTKPIDPVLDGTATEQTIIHRVLLT